MLLARSRGLTGRSEARRWVLLFVLALAVTGIFPTQGLARKRARPPTREEVAVVWIGASTDNLYLLRLDLSLDGAGFGAFTFLDEDPRRFEIASWRYDAGQIRIDPKPPVDELSWVRPLHGSVGGATMELEASARDWTLSFSLRREAEFEEKWRKLRTTMAEPRSE